MPPPSTFRHADGYEEDVAPEDRDEVVVRGGDDGGDVVAAGALLLRVKEVIAHGARDDRLPVLLHEHVAGLKRAF